MGWDVWGGEYFSSSTTFGSEGGRAPEASAGREAARGDKRGSELVAVVDSLLPILLPSCPSGETIKKSHKNGKGRGGESPGEALCTAGEERRKRDPSIPSFLLHSGPTVERETTVRLSLNVPFSPPTPRLSCLGGEGRRRTEALMFLSSLSSRNDP